MSLYHETQAAGVELSYLEPIFDKVGALPNNIDLLRSVVWATNEIRAARIIRISPLRFVRGTGTETEPEEIERPITYNVSFGRDHRLGGFTVLSATWITGPGESYAHYLGRNDFFEHFNETEIHGLTTPEDIFEAYDKRMVGEHIGHTGIIGGKESISPNIYSADGLKLLAQSAPQK